MPDWACRTCGAINLEGQAECEGCGKRRASQPNPFPVTFVPDWQREPPPCTPEENERAQNLVWAVLAREITVEQAHAVLHELCQGREKEL